MAKRGRPRKPLSDRLVAATDKSGGADACWPYRGYRDKNGYGVTNEGSVYIKAHRAAWQLANGQIIPDGMLVCHKCDNPPCVNPAHLFLGTQMDNTHDKIKKGRAIYLRGEAHGRAKLTDERAREIKSLLNVVPFADLAECYGVSKAAIHDIASGRKWRHLGAANG